MRDTKKANRITTSAVLLCLQLMKFSVTSAWRSWEAAGLDRLDYNTTKKTSSKLERGASNYEEKHDIVDDSNNIENITASTENSSRSHRTLTPLRSWNMK